MRILFVAPTTANPDTSGEILRVASGHQVEICGGLVDRAKLERYLAQGTYDVVHFAQHGSQRLLEFSDGALEANELAVMLHTQDRLKFIVLNACDSMATGVAIHNALMVPVVAQSTAIEDPAALRFAESLYRSINAGVDLAAAVENARSVLLRLFPGMAGSPTLINGGRATIDHLLIKLDECASGMKFDMADMRKDLTEAFEQFSKELTDLEALVKSMDSTADRRIRMAMVTLLLLLLIAQVLTPVLNGMLVR